MQESSRYTIQKRLGQGNEGTVYAALDEKTQLQVALKLAHPKLSKQKSFRQRWMRELSLSLRLRHPNIIPVLNYGEMYKTRLFTVMHYAHRGTLAERLKDGARLKDVLSWLLQVLDALAHIHSFGIIHQDLKPENILLASEERIWLSDFSIAHHMFHLQNNPVSIAGTPDWMAPEQHSKNCKLIGPHTDIYAWGLCLARLVSKDGDLGALKSVIEPAIRRLAYERSDIPELRKMLHDIISNAPSSWLQQQVQLQITSPQVSEGDSLLKTRSPFSEDFPKDEALWTIPLEVGLFAQPQYRCWEEQKKQLWSLASEVVDHQQVVITLLMGPRGMGKKAVAGTVYRALQRQGHMDSLTIRYNPSIFCSGYVETLYNILSPENDELDQFVVRWKEWLVKQCQLSDEQAAKQARSLWDWCRLTDDSRVDANLGLAFLFQQLRVRSKRGGACLLLENPEYASLNGDGLQLCLALLSTMLEQRPLFVMAVIDTEDLSVEHQRMVEQLLELGAHKIDFSTLTATSLDEVIHEEWALQRDADVDRIATGRPERIHGVFRQLAYKQRFANKRRIDEIASWEQLLLGKLQSLPAGAQQMLRIVAFSEHKLALGKLPKHYLPAIETLQACGLLREHGRSLELIDGDLSRHIRQQSSKVQCQKAHEELVAIWQGDGFLQEFYRGFHLLRCEQVEAAIGPLLRTVKKARAFHIFYLAEKAASLAIEGADKLQMRALQFESRAQLADAYCLQNKRFQAKQIIDDLKKLNFRDEKSQARLLLLEGRAANWRNREIDKTLYKAEEVFRRIGDKQYLVRCYCTLGEYFAEQQRYSLAGEFFFMASQMAVYKSPEQIIAWRGKVESQLFLAPWTGLRDEIEQFLLDCRQQGNILGFAQASYIMGLWLFRNQKWGAALQHLQTSLSLAVLCGYMELWWENVLLLSTAYCLNQQTDDAVLMLERAQKIVQGLGWKNRESILKVRFLMLFLDDFEDFCSRMDEIPAPQEDPDAQGWWELLVAFRYAKNQDVTQFAQRWMKLKMSMLYQARDPGKSCVLLALIALFYRQKNIGISEMCLATSQLTGCRDWREIPLANCFLDSYHYNSPNKS